MLAVLGTWTKAEPSASVVDIYDYVVVGSGPGGGPLATNLVRTGFKTMLLEAGDDESADTNSQVLAWGRAVGIAESLSWPLWVRHYDDDELEKKYLPDGAEMLGAQYPQNATLINRQFWSHCSAQ
ncbi:hypothetical protein B0J13DRAFT_525570 [Dactylonectria estremocensis]|uniref:Glucose-methanol-choline oxidoreductase N-terminal domain-containing protein n=1 Tax=Dactylonectria estremocensis TaxID=1079267 RepID=A0A9P9J133_9HYPO|nr:hypothetical protein B0J13DRAFT_525570 [Dactylonectria estremocensis]